MTQTESKSHVVLVVDDSLKTISMMNDVLDEAGYKVLIALDGQQALTITKNIVPDIVLMDAIMPGMDGFETSVALKDDVRFSEVPIIFMTGLDDTESVRKGFNAGGVDYVTKPINIQQLVIRMESHIHSSQLTISARNALDTAGQFLFSCDEHGGLLWATPQANDAFEKQNVEFDSLSKELSRKIKEFIEIPSMTMSEQSIQTGSPDLEVRYVGVAGEGKFLFRIVNTSDSADTEILKNTFDTTKRESEVLYWISKGKTNREIGVILSMSPRTVNKHLEQIFKKLGVDNRTSAAAISLNKLSKAH